MTDLVFPTRHPTPHIERDLDELPPPSTFLNFTGDQSSTIGQRRGPSYVGEYLTIVSCEFDAESNKSHVGLAYGIYILKAAD